MTHQVIAQVGTDPVAPAHTEHIEMEEESPREPKDPGVRALRNRAIEQRRIRSIARFLPCGPSDRREGSRRRVPRFGGDGSHLGFKGPGRGSMTPGPPAQSFTRRLAHPAANSLRQMDQNRNRTEELVPTSCADSLANDRPRHLELWLAPAGSIGDDLTKDTISEHLRNGSAHGSMTDSETPRWRGPFTSRWFDRKPTTTNPLP
jgi:hypothetical protein